MGLSMTLFSPKRSNRPFVTLYLFKVISSLSGALPETATTAEIQDSIADTQILPRADFLAQVIDVQSTLTLHYIVRPPLPRRTPYHFGPALLQALR